MWQWIHRLASPKTFYRFSARLLPWIGSSSLILLIYGLVGGLALAPPDYQQGDAFRIIYLHVPCAFMSLFVYMNMALLAAIHLIWRIKLADIIIRASAPMGAWFTFLALVTGAIWGKPMWGTWWIWDARLTSELILLFLYLGFIALQSSLPERKTAAQAGNILLLVGVVNIPIIHFSVVWWNTLHQGATLSRFAKPAIDSSMLYPLLAMILALLCLYLTVTLLWARYALLWQERRSHWVKQLLELP